MKKKLVEVQLVIPDAGILISLAHGDLLGVILEFADTVTVVITDIVKFEVTRRADLFDAKKIEDFLAENKDRIKEIDTGYGPILELARKNPDIKLPENIGEHSIYGFVNDIRSEKPGIPTLVLFEDNWFVKNELGSRPTMVHLVSLVSFLRYAEQVIPDFSFENAIERIKNTRPNVNLVKIDSPGKNSAVGAETNWKPAFKSQSLSM
ncbi:hypothetical protein [Propionivibrio sp.]|uniref:hypothetical protein n=1 Tax=Propionivibrio sp. TaxID=2212460 RepID=UPI003BF334BC